MWLGLAAIIIIAFILWLLTRGSDNAHIRKGDGVK